jgi:hypothetical protein
MNDTHPKIKDLISIETLTVSAHNIHDAAISDGYRLSIKINYSGDSEDEIFEAQKRIGQFIVDSIGESVALIGENEKLREVLSIYADPENWYYAATAEDFKNLFDGVLNSNGYELAQKVLEGKD